MYFGPNAKIALFIDGHYLYSASRNIGFEVDYRNLLDFFRKQGLLVRAYYYVAVLEGEEYSPVKPLIDWLAYNSYTVVTKVAREYSDHEGRRRVKGNNMEVEIVCDMFEMAPRVDDIVLISGSGELLEAVKRVQRDARVTVVSTTKTIGQTVIADELRRQADAFEELTDIAPEFTRRLRETVRTAPAAVRTTPAAVSSAAVSLTATPANPFGEAEVLPEVLPKRRRATA